jgi:hypothetical protein
MGGTYWYYVSQLVCYKVSRNDNSQYKVDEDEEWHDPSEESTTFCPLLPGQRLNVLDVPREGHSRSTSDTSAAFTLNPKDRYLTPVPPAPLKPLPSPRIGAGQEYTMPVPSPWTPRSATYPPTDGFLSPHVVCHARSASASPHIPSTPIFLDFKVLKEKLASKRSASRNRSRSKTRELHISAPVLISGGEDLNLIPLSVYRPSIESLREEPATTTLARPVPTIQREFSPLGSHPVDPDHDTLFGPVELPTIEERPIRRRRSHVPSTVITSEFKVGQSRIRANSADTRRTRHYLFSNDPWLSSPKLQQDFEVEDCVVEDDTPSAPVLSRPSSFLGALRTDERPTSSHGSVRSTKLRQSPPDKELPALPRDLLLAPLSACNIFAISELPTDEPQAEFQEPEDEERLDNVDITFAEKARSHFSTWSNDSIAYSSLASDDDEAVLSPTFSSLTSNDSDVEKGLLIRYSYTEQGSTNDSKCTSTVPEIVSHDADNEVFDVFGSEEDESTKTPPYLSSTPPQLNELRISTFGSDLFDLSDVHTPRSETSARRSSRRQAACFGLGFQYSLPDDDAITSKTSIVSEQDDERRLASTISVQHESSMSQMHALMEDFGFLGDAVI